MWKDLIDVESRRIVKVCGDKVGGEEMLVFLGSWKEEELWDGRFLSLMMVGGFRVGCLISFSFWVAFLLFYRKASGAKARPIHLVV